MIDPVVRYILTQHSSYINLYAFEGFRRRKINVQKISKKLIELYGEYYNGQQFFEFGEKYLNQYLIEKHNISFDDIILEGLQPVIHRFRHLVKS